MSCVGKKDPVKAHRDGTALFQSGNYEGAMDKFLQAYPLYEKVGFKVVEKDVFYEKGIE